MQELIKAIRKSAGLSQEDMAKKLNVSFGTINRWENGHVKPNKSMQIQLYEFCDEFQVPLYDIILERLQKNVAKIDLEPGRMILYHGSKEGIKGQIAPISRAHCDFGQGFYMGTDPIQSLTLICDFPKSKFYILSVQTNGLSQITISADIEWAMLVAYHRGRMDKIKGTAFYNKYATVTQGKDLVIGSIANDRMFYVIDRFFENIITDVALVESLSALNLGQQYVMLTQKGCDAVRIEAEIELSDLERKCLQEVSVKNRLSGSKLADNICKAKRKEGKIFDEILEENGGILDE